MRTQNNTFLQRNNMGRMYKIIFFFCLCFSPLAYAVSEPLEAMWWKEMHARATLKKDEIGNVFAIEVQFTNRSATDTALIDQVEPPIIYSGFSFYISEIIKTSNLDQAGEKLTIDRHVMPQIIAAVGGESKAVTPKSYVKIPPGKSHTFCVNLEKYLKPKATIHPNKNYSLVLYFGNMLAWKRRSGKTTMFGLESYGDIDKPQASRGTNPPTFDFSPQKLSAHKNRSCSSTNSLVKK